MKNSKDSLGNRVKEYENLFRNKAMKGLPVIIRLDGKGFSKFTKRFNRPFCDTLKGLMEKVTIELVKETNALIGYTQSDEVTLILYNDNYKGQLYFDGDFNKLNSVLAGKASSVFTKELIKIDKGFLEEDLYVSFDSRAFTVPSKVEAANTLLWRYKDCLKNSVTQVAQEFFSHKILMGVSTKNRLQMLEDINKPWYEYPSQFKEGSFFKKGYYKRLDVVYYDCMDIGDKVKFIFGEDDL